MIREELLDRIFTNNAASRCHVDRGCVAAVLMVNPNASVLEWCKDDSFRRFHVDYPKCRDTPVVPEIRFPISDARIQDATYARYLDLAERMGCRVVQYEGDKIRGWFLDDCTRWRDLFGMEVAARVLEIGATDGVSTNA